MFHYINQFISYSYIVYEIVHQINFFFILEKFIPNKFNIEF